MKLTISKEGALFVVDDKSRTGSQPVGRGKTMIEAIGSFFHNNQSQLDIEFEVEPSAERAEMTRRRRELAYR